MCDSAMNKQECLKALQLFKNGKYPDNDGFTALLTIHLFIHLFFYQGDCLSAEALISRQALPWYSTKPATLLEITATVLLFGPIHRQNSNHHGL